MDQSNNLNVPTIRACSSCALWMDQSNNLNVPTIRACSSCALWMDQSNNLNVPTIRACSSCALWMDQSNNLNVPTIRACKSCALWMDQSNNLNVPTIRACISCALWRCLSAGTKSTQCLKYCEIPRQNLIYRQYSVFPNMMHQYFLGLSICLVGEYSVFRRSVTFFRHTHFFSCSFCIKILCMRW